MLGNMSIMGTGVFIPEFENTLEPASWCLSSAVASVTSEWIIYLCARPVLAPKAQRLTVRGIQGDRSPSTASWVIHL